MNCTACGVAAAPGTTTCASCGASIVPPMVGGYVRVDTSTEKIPSTAERIRPLAPPPPSTPGVVSGLAPVIVQPPAPRPPVAGLISVPPSIHSPVAPTPPAPIEPAPQQPVGAPAHQAQAQAQAPSAVAGGSSIDEETRVAPRRIVRTWILALPTGERLPLSSSVIVGREPSASLVAGAGALAVNDPEKSVSKSHAAFELSENGLTVRDLASTNGIIVVDPQGDDVEVYGDVAVDLYPGSFVELGRYVIRIEADPA